MAEAPDVRDKPLEELKREITCAVCQGHYQQAKLLPCNHYYCGTCIEKLAERSRGKPFDCPECRKETRLPPGGVAELQSAFFVERMKDVYAKMAKAEGKMEAVCEQCIAGGKSVAFCCQCAEFICDNCVRVHQELKVFAGHVVASLEDLKSGGAKNIPLKVAPPLKCPDHDQVIKIFCFDCDHLICRDCAIIDHNGHNFNFLKKCAPESRKTLRDSLAPLQKVQAGIAGAEKTLISEETKVDTQKNEVCKSIEESFDKLKAVLDQQKAELVKKASTLAQEKKDALAAQQTRFQVAQTEIQLVVELVERNIESTSDQDLMCICTQLQTKMEEEEKRHQQLSLEPTATADIFCNLPSPDAIPKDLGTVSSQKIPALQQNIKSCELGASMQVSLVAPTATLADISADLKCVANPLSSLQGDVIEKGVGIYSITHTPQVRGRHDLIVKVKDKEIDGSPFRVVVKIPPTQLGQPVHQIEGLEGPWGIAINNKQQLVVAEGDGRKITIMERDGKKVQTIECTEFQDPCGVAAGPDGPIYVTDFEADCLFKFDTEGRLLKTVCTEVQLLQSIKIIQNQLYVVDNASFLVKIFDMDCNVVGTIQTKECPNPRDIAQGPDGLYVAGEKKISVYRCAPNGNFIRHLNIQPSSLNLSEFWGICFDSSGHIIATDCCNGVYVFNPSGECVGHVSSDVISQPVGVTVDEDGFVYVCGFRSSNVLVL
jgi:DNA-binding beta-propeller fold protein YncE